MVHLADILAAEAMARAMGITHLPKINMAAAGTRTKESETIKGTALEAAGITANRQRSPDVNLI